MRPQRHLVVMVREPRLGAVKRRLARDIGPLAAWRFYRLTTMRLLRQVACDRRWRTWLAVTPDRTARRSAAAIFSLPARISPPIVPQGRGDLGARMSRLLHDLPPGPVVIVGSDIPTLGAAQIARAFAALGDHDWVFGPAHDGGYWLIGARRRMLRRSALTHVRWSSEHALADTLASLGPARVALLETLADIDDGADFARWIQRERAAVDRAGRNLKQL